MKSWIIIVLAILYALGAYGCSEYMQGKVCGTHEETYTQNQDGCDQMTGCHCIEEEFLGLGQCDTCECVRQVSNC